MPLAEIWKADKSSVLTMTIEQIASIAGDGKLLDNSGCQSELRQYLREASTDSLEKYASHCLDNAFSKGGYVLQDVINELGRRLEYTVENGRYQGVKNEVGFDGLWIDDLNQSLVVEVKTTDAYRMSLDTMATYRRKLITKQKVDENSSILIVVGRTDTGELEAQVRGSPHAWHIRIIGVGSLIQLVRVKESTGSQETIRKIRTLLAPHEYTRVDDLVEVVFAATKDVEAAPELLVDTTSEVSEKSDKFQDKTAPQTISYLREQIISAMAVALNSPLIKKTQAMYWSPDHKSRIACTISKRYESKGVERYWYAYHPAWDAFLGEGETSRVALGCVGSDLAFLLPLEVMRAALSHLNVTEKPDGSHYWHVKIVEPEAGKFYLLNADGGKSLSLTKYGVPLNSSS